MNIDEQIEELKLLMTEFIKDTIPPTSLINEIEHKLWALDFERRVERREALHEQ